jgi:hypothetical protein
MSDVSPTLIYLFSPSSLLDFFPHPRLGIKPEDGILAAPYRRKRRHEK